MKDAFQTNGMSLQLFLPHTHRQNAVERVICKFKNNLITSLCTWNPKYPANKWDRPTLLGKFNFNTTPLAPPGNQVLPHENPSKRGSFAPHGID